jgi:2-methylcitrate dehydratase PrpD
MTEPMSHRHDGRTRSAVERIAPFAAAARPEHLTTNIRQLHKRNILDSLGCAITAILAPVDALAQKEAARTHR